MSDNTSESGRRPGGLNKLPDKRPKYSIYWVYAILAVAFAGMYYMNSGSSAQELKDINEFKFQMLQPGDVERIVVVNGDRAEIYIKKEAFTQEKEKYNKYFTGSFTSAPQEGPQFFLRISSFESFEQQVKAVQNQQGIPEAQQVPVNTDKRADYLGGAFQILFPILLFIGIWIFIMRRMSGGSAGGAGGIFSVGKSRAQVFDKETAVKIDFKDVAGLEEAKVEIKEIVDFLKNPKKYTDLGGKIPKGALLVGPPGTGKTLLAKAVAGEANVPFFSISGSDFVEMFVGVGASRVRDLFKQAKEKAPCIIFIDEVDAIGRARGKNPNFGSNDERENTLNQLLTEMDGFATNAGVIVLAATNRADILDKALLRAGRFDRQINVDLPDLNERKAIFEVHLRPLKLDNNLDVNFLSRQTPGFSGADIANVCNEAALIAARGGKKVVEKQDFLDAVDRIVGGLERKNRIISPGEKRTIAFHEAGHATVSWMLEHANPLVKVTIIPRGRALGAAWYLPEERQITTLDQLMDEMAATLGGRAAEELTFGQISTGALNDLERVTKQAYAMVSYFGMGKQIGNLSFYDSTGHSEYSFSKPYSERTAESIDKEVKEIVEMAYKEAKEVLSEHKDGLATLASLLLEKEVIFSEDLEHVFGKRPFHTEVDSEPATNTQLEENKEPEPMNQSKEVKE